MRLLTSLSVAALVTLFAGADAFAQRHAPSRHVTHSPSIHRGNVGQTAVRVGTPRATVVPVSKIRVTDRHGNFGRHGHRGHGHGHSGHFRPRHYGHVHGPSCIFSAAHYETQYNKVYVPGHYEKRYIPPRYEVQYRHGRSVNVLVASGCYKDVYIEGYYRSDPYQVYVPASWSCGFYF